MEQIKNHGVLLGNRPDDWIAGTIPYKVLNPTGDWTKWLPQGEWQYIQNIDLQACVTFSALNVIEILYYFLTNKQRNFSDRFTATMSGTTRNGNYLWKVGDSIRKDGLVDEADWPTPEVLTWENYYVMPKIEIINKGRKFPREWLINYEVIEPTKESILYHLKQSPIQVCIPGHAVVTFTNPAQVYKYFDSYEPFIKEWGQNFVFAQKYVMSRNRPAYIEKIVKLKNKAKCWIIYCGMKFEIVGDKVFNMLGLDWNEVQEVSEWQLAQYALASPITEDRIEHFREFFSDSPAEWKLKYAPTIPEKVIGLFQLVIERIKDWLGYLPFGGMEFLGRHRLGWNCVLYARSRYPSLPEGLWSLWSKKRIINSQIPQIGAVAIMNTGWVGHCGIVTSFTQDFSWIEIEEANFRRGFLTKRNGSPKDLRIIGYFI